MARLPKHAGSPLKVARPRPQSGERKGSSRRSSKADTSSGKRIKVGLIGLGAIGRMHFDCWRQSAAAQLTAVSARDQRKLAGNWVSKDFNLGKQSAARIDLTGIATYQRAEELIADGNVQLVDICMPTPMHASLAIAALRAGKHVFCEKPMALNIVECVAMEEAAREAGRQLMIGHCLRYWPHYVKAHELLVSGQYGRPIYASFFRTSAAPMWSSDGWLMKGKESGGVLDMHIHDIDVALWWFGRPHKITATGREEDGLPLIVDAIWSYNGGLTAHLHSAWDRNGGAFRHGFKLVMEKATLIYDLGADADSLLLLHDGKERALPMDKRGAHQAELDDFAQCLAQGREMTRITTAESRAAVEIGLDELRQFTT